VHGLQRLGIEGGIKQLLGLEEDFRTYLIGLKNGNVLFLQVKRAELQIISQSNLVSLCVIQELLEQVLVLLNQNVRILVRLAELKLCLWLKHLPCEGLRLFIQHQLISR